MGPGNLASGLKYSLYTDSAKRYAAIAGIAILKSEYILTTTEVS